MLGLKLTRAIGTLEISAEAYDEIVGRLVAAGHIRVAAAGVLDMSGISLAREAKEEPAPPDDAVARHYARVLSRKAS